MIMKSIYIVTKPLQFVNCTNIPRDINNKDICCICDQFSEAYHFFDVCKKRDDRFDNYFFYKNKEIALVHWLLNQSGVNKLYIDSDFGLLTRFLLLLFFKVEIFIYEEGYASYNPLRTDNGLKNKFLLKIQKIFCIKNFNGGSCKVKGVYLYNKLKYDRAFPLHNKELLAFDIPFFDAVEKSKVLKILSNEIEWRDFIDKDVLIYLSSWNISIPAVNYCNKRDNIDVKVLKLHPNIKKEHPELSSTFDVILPSNIMFEYFYANVRKIVKSITIVHHNSFAVEYIDEKDKANSVVI